MLTLKFILAVTLSVITAVAGAPQAEPIAPPFTIQNIRQPFGDTQIRAITYTDGNGQQQIVNNSWSPATLPWNWQMTHAGYTTRVKEDFTAGQVIQFSTQGEYIYLQPMALQWTNDLNQIQQIAIPQNVPATIGHEQSWLTNTITNREGFVRWDNSYGNGVNFKWQNTPNTLEKILEVETLSNLPAPPQFIINGGNPCLTLNLIFSPSASMDIYVDNALWDERTKVQTVNVIEFRKNGQTLWMFDLLKFWDSGNLDGQSVATLDKSGNNLFILIKVPYSWLQQATFPVFIDADVTINNGVNSLFYSSASRGGVFWVSTTTGYVILIDSSNYLVYQKTTNGGATWAAASTISSGTIIYFDAWADWQTAGDTGTKIHVLYIDANTDDIRYVYLDTSGDSVGGDDQIEACQGTGAIYTAAVTLDKRHVSITKSRGGNIAVAFHYQDSNLVNYYSFYTSSDATTWTSKTSPYESAAADYIQLYAGNEADNNDLWAVFWDASADAISLKTYDNSGDSWAEQAISSSMTESLNYLQFDGQIRLSDGHLILAAWNLFDNAASDLLVWDINGSGSITAKTNIITNEAESFAVSVFINQVNDDIYVAYFSGTTAESIVACFYQKSTDDGATWGGETAMQADAEDDERWISAGCMKASLGGKFQPVWFNDDLNDLFTNTTNGITINAASAGAAFVPKIKFY